MLALCEAAAAALVRPEVRCRPQTYLAADEYLDPAQIESGSFIVQQESSNFAQRATKLKKRRVSFMHHSSILHRIQIQI